MKFDHIVGNPPYQYPKNSGKSVMSKLYIDISVRIQKFVKDSGSLSFVTPKAILYSQSKIQKLLEDLVVVDYKAHEYFVKSVDVLIVSWQVKPQGKTQDEIKVCMSNDKVKYVKEKKDLSNYNEEMLISILNKVNRNYNNRKRMCIRNASSQDGTIEMKKCHVLQDEKNKYPVYCARQKYVENIGYTDSFQTSQPRIVIPFGRIYANAKNRTAQIVPGMIDEMFYVTTNQSDIDNKLMYLNSKLIIYCVNEYIHKIKNSGFNEFLSKLPQLDFTRSWSNEELYKEFAITKDEQSQIETWYNNWLEIGLRLPQ